MARSRALPAAGTLLLASLGSVAVLTAHGAGVMSVDTHESTQYAGTRLGETVVVPGADLTAFAGATDDELWVWTWREGEWHRLQSQLDERDAAGDYVTGEGDGLDEGDELVFPLDPDGVAAPAGAWPPGIERRLPPMVVRVTDPLDPALDAYAHIFLSRYGPEGELEPLITFDRDALELRSDAYVLGFADSFADGFVGYKRLSLFGSESDLLDRLKIRVAVRFASIEQTVTEEQLELLGVDLPGLTPNPVIVGPVRVVLDTGGAAVAYKHRFELVLEGVRDIEPPPNFELQGVRCSLDFSTAADGSTYSDANTEAGVTVDGSPDSVSDSPVPAWREITSTDGRLVVLSRSAGPAVSARTYYKDDSTVDPLDTGDMMSYADNGVAAPDVDQFVNAGFPGELVAVSAGDDVTAAQLSAHAASPLVVDVSVGTPPETATSPAVTETPTPPPATTVPATAPPTDTATLTVTAVGTTVPPPTAAASPSATGGSTPAPTETATGGGSDTPPVPTATDTSPTPDPGWAHAIVLPLCTR